MDKRPCLKFAVILSLGIIIERYLNFPLFPLLLFTTLIAAFYFITPLHFRTSIIISGLIMLGMLRYASFMSISDKNHIVYKDAFGKRLEVSGWIKDKRGYYDERTKYVMEVTGIKQDGATEPASGRILINYYGTDFVYRYGQKTIVYGRLLKPRDSRNPGEFDYAGYLRNKGIFGIVNVSAKENLIFGNKRKTGFLSPVQKIEKMKYSFSANIRKKFSGQECELLKGLLLGEREGLEPEIKEEFARSGILHILAVSGLHVGFVIFFLGLAVGLFRFPNAIKYVIIILGIIGYVYLTGARAPVLRASLIAGIILLGIITERRVDMLNSLGAAGLILLLFRPDDLFSASFQLSFTAVFGIIFIIQMFTESFGGRLKKMPRSYRLSLFKRYVLLPLLVSFSIVVFISPVSGYYFSRISPIAVIVNIAVVPLTGLVIGLGFTSLLLGYISPVLCEPLNAVLHLLLKSIILIAEKASTVPFAFVDVSRETVLIVIIGYILVYFTSREIKRGRRNRIIVYMMIFLNVLLWDRIIFHPPGRMKVVFFDVGQGDSAFLKMPDNSYILIDGGRKGFSFDAGLYAIIPYLKRNGIGSIDRIILSHPDADHIGGIPAVIENVSAGTVYIPDADKESGIYDKLNALIENKKIPRKTISGGMQIGKSQYYRIYVLHPPENYNTEDVNDLSLVVKVVYGDCEFLFTGDIGFEPENILARYDGFLESDVLKIAHHGSRFSTSENFLQMIKPRYAIISVGEYNLYNLPNPMIIERLQRNGIQIARTDRSGAAVFETDGKTLDRVR